jgi:DNA-binding transcriptional ArsR family regulator
MLRNYAINSPSSEPVAADEMAKVLRAVAEPGRLRLLRLCYDQPTSVSELAAAVADSEPNVSRQLKQLAIAGLVRRARRGQRVEYLPVMDIGFAAEAVALLLSRLDPSDPVLRDARERLRALESADLAARDGLSPSRLGRSLALALGSALGAPAEDTAASSARWLARVAHPELLEVLAQRVATVTLRADTAEERAALLRWSEEASRAAVAPRATFEIGSARQSRQAAPFDACFDAPRPGELQAPAQVAAWLGRLRATLRPQGLLWCVVPYELLEQEGTAPPTRLRALLAAQGLECLAVAPLEADGRHVLVAQARAS